MIKFVFLGIIILYQSIQIPPDQYLFQKWLYACEAEKGGSAIYHPTSFDYPFSWGRSGMKFKKDGGFILYEVTPNDEIVQIFGTWNILSKNQLEISFSSNEKENVILEIKKLTSHELMVNIKEIKYHN